MTIQPEPLGDVQWGATQAHRCDCGEAFTQTFMPVIGWAPKACEACRLDEGDAERGRLAGIAKDQLERELAGRLRVLDVPDLFRDATLAAFKQHGTTEERAAQERFLAKAAQLIDRWPDRKELPPVLPLIVVMAGPPGTGKSMLGYAVARAVVEEYGAVARVVKLGDLIRDLRSAWDRGEGGMSESERLRKYREADLLVIDEVSTHAFHGDPESKRQHLYDCIAYREERMRPTILTSNEETEAALATVLGEALFSRVHRYDGFWNASWADYRELQRKAWVRRERRAQAEDPTDKNDKGGK